MRMRKVFAIVVFLAGALLNNVGAMAQSPYYNYNQVAPPPQTGWGYSSANPSDYYAHQYGGVWWCRAESGQCASLLSRAEKGDVDAQDKLARYYEDKSKFSDTGRCDQNDCRWAFYWYKVAAQNGHPDAANDVGLCYWSGYGVRRDDSQALAWFQRAVQLGDHEGWGSLNQGLMYYMYRDYARAFVSLQAAARNGNAKAEAQLGKMYWEGSGVTQDYARGVAYYRMAASKGVANAETNLGVAYYFGKGVPKDLNQAIAWYRKAAAHGDSVAQQNLANLFAAPDSPAAGGTASGICQGPNYEWRYDGLYGNAANCYPTTPTIPRDHCSLGDIVLNHCH